jgi:hypothetical protein
MSALALVRWLLWVVFMGIGLYAVVTCYQYIDMDPIPWGSLLRAVAVVLSSTFIATMVAPEEILRFAARIK